MGITITVGGIAGIPLLVLSGPIISKIGHANVLFIGFVFYAIRLCGEHFNSIHSADTWKQREVTISIIFIVILFSFNINGGLNGKQSYAMKNKFKELEF